MRNWLGFDGYYSMVDGKCTAPFQKNFPANQKKSVKYHFSLPIVT
ncbi:MAG: hypothetical protein ACI4MJ_02325 [Aristaeellaceae bacterium]